MNEKLQAILNGPDMKALVEEGVLPADLGILPLREIALYIQTRLEDDDRARAERGID